MIFLGPLFLFFVVSVRGGAPLPQGSNCPHSELVSCLLQYMDTDGNNAINETEVNNYMLTQPCGLETNVMSGAQMILYCDMDHDGWLTPLDYYDPAGCMRTLGVQRVLCDKCRMCAHYNDQGRRRLPSSH